MVGAAGSRRTKRAMSCDSVSEVSGPVATMTGPPADPFFGPLARGTSAEATYVFRLPDDASAPITLTVNPVPDAAVAVFSGDPS